LLDNNIQNVDMFHIHSLIASDGTIYRIVSNIVILRSYRGISLSW